MPMTEQAIQAMLQDIKSITDAALSRLDDQEFLAQLLDRVKDVLHVDTAAILHLDRTELIAAAAAGLEAEARQGVRVPLGAGFASRIVIERRPVIIDHVDSAAALNPILVSNGICCMLGVPLVANGTVIGVMHVGSLTAR